MEGIVKLLFEYISCTLFALCLIQRKTVTTNHILKVSYFCINVVESFCSKQWLGFKYLTKIIGFLCRQG